MSRTRSHLLIAAAMLVLGVPSISTAQPTRPLELVVEAPGELESVAGHVRNFDVNRLSGVMRLIGMEDPGPPIRVVLVTENSVTAQETPAWVAGFAEPSGDVLVLFPARIGSYPYGSIERVLFHEVAHLLTSRVANGARIPRWFNEGLASAAERTWGIEDRSRFAWEVIVGGHVTATQLEGMFGEGSRDVARAYVLSEALVRDILERHGPFTAARLFRQMQAGAPFDLALYSATGLTVTEHVAVFWKRSAVWERWIAFLGHPLTLWGFVTLLALLAIWRHRRRRVERRLRWELQERTEDQQWEEHRRRHRVH